MADTDPSVSRSVLVGDADFASSLNCLISAFCCLSTASARMRTLLSPTASTNMSAMILFGKWDTQTTDSPLPAARHTSSSSIESPDLKSCRNTLPLRMSFMNPSLPWLSPLSSSGCRPFCSCDSNAAGRIFLLFFRGNAAGNTRLPVVATLPSPIPWNLRGRRCAHSNPSAIGIVASFSTAFAAHSSPWQLLLQPSSRHIQIPGSA